MNAIVRIIKDHPHEKAAAFVKQFEDWSDINEFGNIDPISLQLAQIATGGDRIVYKTKHPDILLKAAFGPQEAIVPDGFENLYLPFYECEFPVPLQDPCFQDGRPFGQFQQKITPHRPFGQAYAPTRALQKDLHRMSCDIAFANALIKHYSIDFLLSWMEAFQKNRGMRAPSNQNWGYLNGAPIIFDYGRIIE